MALDQTLQPGDDRLDDDYFCIDEPPEPAPLLPWLAPDHFNLRVQPVSDTPKPPINWPVPAIFDIDWADD